MRSGSKELTQIWGGIKLDPKRSTQNEVNSLEITPVKKIDRDSSRPLIKRSQPVERCLPEGKAPPMVSKAKDKREIALIQRNLGRVSSETQGFGSPRARLGSPPPRDRQGLRRTSM